MITFSYNITGTGFDGKPYSIDETQITNSTVDALTLVADWNKQVRTDTKYTFIEATKLSRDEEKEIFNSHKHLRNNCGVTTYVK
jgi:hypothetical protein